MRVRLSCLLFLFLFMFVACESRGIASPPARLDWANAERGGVLPPQLTGTDGTGLALVSLEAQVVVQAPLAFTELRMRFRNPESRVREGNFEITLPVNASLSRFAMKVGDHYQEGEVVERKLAQRVYEDFLHRKQDPALLEHDAGNRFRARVFPIGPGEDKEIILSYSEELNEKGDAYRLHLAGLPKLPSLKVRVLANDGEHKLEQQNVEPRGDLVLSGGPGVLADLAVRAGELYLVRTKPMLDTTPAKLESLTILFDTSASGALGFDARAERVLSLTAQWAKELKRDFEVRLVAFDQGVAPLHVGPASRLTEEGLRALRKRGPLGASDLEGALTALGKDKVSDRVLLVSDAVVTAGEQKAGKLTELVTKLKGQGLARLDVLLVGGIHDDALAQSLVTAKLSHVGVVLRENQEDEDIVSGLVRQPLANVPVQLSGASWYWPRKVASLLPGGYVTVLASVKGKDAPELRVGNGKPVRPVPLEVAEPLLRRSWARAKLAELEARLATVDESDVAQRTQLESEITALSVRHRVLTSRTALLVLEREEDYAMYKLDRTSLADILSVGKNGISVLSGAQRAPEMAEIAKVRRNISNRPLAQPKGGGAVDEGAAPGADSFAREPNQAPRDDAPTATIREEAPAEADNLLRAATAAAPVMEAESAMGQSASASRMRGSVGEGPPSRSIAEGSTPTATSVWAGVVAFEDVRVTAGPREPRLVQALEYELQKRKRAVEVCYEQQRRRDPNLEGVFTITTTMLPAGVMEKTEVVNGASVDAALRSCVTDTVKRFRFNLGTQETEPTTFTAVARLSRVRRPAPPPPRWDPRRVEGNEEAIWRVDMPPELRLEEALEGPLLNVAKAIEGKNPQGALEEAWRFRADDPGSVLALIAVGRALEASGNLSEAARAYGSIIDLFPSRTDLRRTAGNFLERLAQPDATALAVDTYQRAREQRPDHPNSHRLYAYALVKVGRHAEAFAVLREGRARAYPDNRFAGYDEILAEDLRIVATAWKHAQPERAESIDSDLKALGLSADTTPSLRFILSWETDANDVDFHIYDGKNGHASYKQRKLPSGGELLADVTTGYGPERFRIDRPKTFPYVLVAHYYTRGPMGIGMGKVQVVYHDGKGGLTFDERPFVIMKDQASIALGTVKPDDALFPKKVAKR